jgi:hypothetical protein
MDKKHPAQEKGRFWVFVSLCQAGLCVANIFLPPTMLRDNKDYSKQNLKHAEDKSKGSVTSACVLSRIRTDRPARWRLAAALDRTDTSVNPGVKITLKYV